VCEGSYYMHAEQPCIFSTMNRFNSQQVANNI
jgi:hypothetical protein